MAQTMQVIDQRYLSKVMLAQNIVLGFDVHCQAYAVDGLAIGCASLESMVHRSRLHSSLSLHKEFHLLRWMHVRESVHFVMVRALCDMCLSFESQCDGRTTSDECHLLFIVYL